jgi:pimeloyl-ACP methyl ester carboxylesterase
MGLHFKKYGEGKDYLVILHGLFGSLDNWQSLGKEFGNYFTTYIVDQRNHGKSPHFDEHNYSLMAADLKAFLEQQGVDETHLLGHSMGGKTVMQFSIQEPQFIKKMIVADIAPKYYAPHHQDVISALESVDFSIQTNRKKVQLKLEESIFDIGIVQFLMKGLTWVSKNQMGWKFNLKVLSERIESIGEELEGFAYFTNPTLFLRGENSDYITLDDIDTIEEIFPMAQYSTIENSGHWMHAENPKRFFEEVLNFLK